jgi:2-C-methyl-D-erythritol 4-phosphate cytidylyltransferase
MDQMNASVILPAAGSGTRFAQGSPESALNKIELDIAGKPVFLYAVELFIQRPDVGQVILAVAPDQLADFAMRWGDKLGFLGVQLVPGGETERWQTVANAMKSVPDDATHIAVHDAARPLASHALIDRVFSAAARFDAVIPGCDVGSTLKRVGQADATDTIDDPINAILGSAGKAEDPARPVIETVDRKQLVAVQTPQVFNAALLRRAYQQIADGGVDPAKITDDAQLVEALGETVYIVQGEPANLKITHPGDAELAQALLEKRQQSHAGDLARKRLFGDDDDD